MYAFISEKPYIEYHAGRLVRKVSSNTWHSLVMLAMGTILRRCAGGRGRVGPEWHFDMSVQLGTKTILVPDVAFVARERLFGLSADFLQVPGFAPDIAVEIRSPNDRPGEGAWKIGAYLEAGSALVLDISPQDRTIRAIAPSFEDSIFAAGQTFEHPAAPWLVFDVDEVFADLTI